MRQNIESHDLLKSKTMNKTQEPPEDREFDKSGFYPENGKSFRIWALLAWLAGTVIVLALISAFLNFILL